MTQAERELVLGVIAGADGGCGGCVGDLIDRLESVLPDEGFRALWQSVDGDTYDRISVWKGRHDAAVQPEDANPRSPHDQHKKDDAR